MISTVPEAGMMISVMRRQVVLELRAAAAVAVRPLAAPPG